MKKTILVVIAALSSACATQGKYREKLDAWRGHDISGLISQMGPPVSAFKSPNGNTVYTFRDDGGVTATANRDMFGDQRVRSVSAIQNYCETNVTAGASNIILSSSFHGNMCKSH